MADAADLLEVHAVNELPLPFSPPSDTITPFCSFSSSAIPETEKQAKTFSGIPFGLTFSPFVDEELPQMRKSPSTCSKCASIINCYCEIGQTFWVCPFCGQENPSQGLDGGERFPELVRQDVEYIDPLRQPLQLSTSSASPVYFFLIDGNIINTDMKELANSIISVLDHLPTSARIGFIVFTGIISIYEVTSNGFVSSELYSGSKKLSDDQINHIKYRKNRFVVSLEHWKLQLRTVLAAISKRAPEKQSNRKRQFQQPRGFGAALHLAMSLIDENTNRKPGGQIVSFLGGCPNYGPGGVLESVSTEEESDFRTEQAKKFYKSQGQRARENKISLDIYCIGTSNFRVRVLQNLVLSNGGIIILLKECSDPQLAENLLLALNRNENLLDGSFDVRCSPSLTISHIIGPAVPSTEEEEEGVDHCEVTAIQRDFTFSLFYRIRDTIVANFVYFQFVVHYKNAKNEQVTRVITHRIEATCSIPKIISSFQQHVIVVLLAKRYVLAARKAPLSQLSAVITKLDLFVKRLFSFMSRNEDAARYLRDVGRMLFLLRRGPLLGPILQHSDDIDCCRCLFLHSSLSVCLRLIEPPFYHVQSGDIRPLPLEDIALRTSSILLLDHHTDILIWEGKGVPKDVRDNWIATAQQIANDKAIGRFPRPYIMICKERSSMARWLLCRLIPSHKDPKENHFASFPDLRGYSEEDYKKLLRQFHDTDDFSFHQYFQLQTNN